MRGDQTIGIGRWTGLWVIFKVGLGAANGI